MAKKLYKKKYTREDEILINWYIFYVLKGRLFLRVCEKSNLGNYRYIELESRYQNVNRGICEVLFFDRDSNGNHTKLYIVDLVVKEPSGSITTVYHNEGNENKYGVTYEIFNSAKKAYDEAVKKDLSVEFKITYTILVEAKKCNSSDALVKTMEIMKHKYPSSRWNEFM